MSAAVIAFFRALPELVGLLKEFIDLFRGFVSDFQERQREQWIQEGRATERKLIEAKTDEERAQVLAELQRLRSSTPSA